MHHRHDPYFSCSLHIISIERNDDANLVSIGPSSGNHIRHSLRVVGIPADNPRIRPKDRCFRIREVDGPLGFALAAME
jgi:hypothetical protein